VAVLACLLARKTLTKSHDGGARELDLPGQSLAVIVLGAFTLAFIEGPHWGWSSPWTVGFLIAATAAAAGFVAVERASSAPLLPVGLFQTSQFSVACAIAACMTFGMYATLFLSPLYLQSGRGVSAVVAGLELMPMPVAFVLLSQWSGKLATRFGARVVMTIGMASMGAGQLMLAFVSAYTSVLYLELAFLVIGIGICFNTGPVVAVAVSAEPKDYACAASGVLNTARIVG